MYDIISIYILLYNYIHRYILSYGGGSYNIVHF